MKEELSAKDKEIEQLKYEMIDLSSRLTAESKKHREAVIQSAAVGGDAERDGAGAESA